MIDVSQLEPYQQRVHAECAELDDKIEKLSQFLSRKTWTLGEDYERYCLYRQLSAMSQYAAILKERLLAFKTKLKPVSTQGDVAGVATPYWLNGREYNSKPGAYALSGTDQLS